MSQQTLGQFCDTLDISKGRSKQFSECTGNRPQSKESMEGVKKENKPGTLMRETQPFSFFSPGAIKAS